MFEEHADNFADIFRGGLPYYLLLTLPILIICSGSPVLAAENAKEYQLYSYSGTFPVQRMATYDLNGVAYGCRASALSLEAKSLYTWSTARHCVVVKLQDLTIDHFREIRQKAGGLIILLPNNVASLSADDKEHIMLLEQAMLAQANSIPIYFSPFSKDFEHIVDDITRSMALAHRNAQQQMQRRSAVAELFDSISANGYQVTVSGASHAPNKNSKISLIQGELTPVKFSKAQQQQQQQMEDNMNSKLPLIMLTAHLNTLGLYNEYTANADAAVLLTIAELFSKLHNTPNAVPKMRLMFLLSESNVLLNFQGAKKWLDENVQLQNVDFILCLDTITQALQIANGAAAEDGGATPNAIYMHVSKPPKDGTPMSNFYRLLKMISARYNNNQTVVEGVHKKINLADATLSWEHERFSMKRLPAFTLSSLKSPKQSVRTTVFSDSEEQIVARTQLVAKIIAEALARYIYNVDDVANGGELNGGATGSSSTSQFDEIFSGVLQIPKAMVKSHLNLRATTHNNDLKNAFEKYLKNVKIIHDKPDAREPDFMLYDGHEASLNLYRVKPAVFDLFLTLVICAYLTGVYFVIQYFPRFYDVVCKMTKATATASLQSNNGGIHHHHERTKVKAN